MKNREQKTIYDRPSNSVMEGAPLADRMRPRSLEEFAGQSHILSPGKLLRRAIQADQLSSLIFYGPPGTGKTTLARIIANTTQAQFLSLNAVLSGVKDIRECIAAAEIFRDEQQRKTILFIDEVHRFNKAQQDALLPHVENGTVILIGATTENPYFEVNKALVSRSRIFQLIPLTNADLEAVVNAALTDKKRGYGKLNVQLDSEAMDHLIRVSNGDARALLNALELAVITSEPVDGAVHIGLEVAEESIQQRAVLYDKDGDAHFDTISAFIKSLRGSDPDAALYWMAKMVYGGEDPRFIFRRMIIFASEDIGMADPMALNVVTSAAQAFDYVGMPEGRFHLAEACLYLATAPKSNSGFAFFDALDTVRNERDDDVPNHLKDGNRDKEGFGHGQGYLYPHSYQEHWVAQQYLPDTLQGRVFYQPTNRGHEAGIRDDVSRRRESQLAAMMDSQQALDETIEEHWQGRTLGNTGEMLGSIRDHLFGFLDLGRDDLILILNAGNGLLLGEALRQSTESSIHALVQSEVHQGILETRYQNRDLLYRPIIQSSAYEDQKLDLSEIQKQGIHFDQIMGINGLALDQPKSDILKQVRSVSHGGTILAFAESIPVLGQRLSEYLPENQLDSSIVERVLETESGIYGDQENNKVNWNDQTLLENLEVHGFKIQQQSKKELTNELLISEKKLEEWFSLSTFEKPTFAMHLKSNLDNREIELVKQALKTAIVRKIVPWKTTWLFIKAVCFE